jgi:hypothetical protein
MTNPFSTENLVPNWTVATEILKGDVPGHDFHGNQWTGGNAGEHFDGYSPMDTKQTLGQIGKMTVLSISGGRVNALRNSHGDTVGVNLPVSHGYGVNVLLHPNDTYTVQRTFTRSGITTVKGQEDGIHAGEISDTAYRAGMYQNVEFGGHVKKAEQSVAKGDVAGHPFHGNQYTISSQVSGNNVEGSDSKNYVEGRNGVFRSNLNSQYHKIQRGDTLDAIKQHFSGLRLRNRQTVELTKGSPDESKVVCKYCGRNKTEPSPDNSKPDTGRATVTWDPKTKDFVRNADGSVQGQHYTESWGNTLNQINNLGMQMRGRI